MVCRYRGKTKTKSKQAQLLTMSLDVKKSHDFLEWVTVKFVKCVVHQVTGRFFQVLRF